MTKESPLKAMIRRFHNLPDPWKGYYRKWQIHRRFKSLEVRTYGACYWTKVVFRWKNGREFYRLTRGMKLRDEDTYRSEYFRGKLIRRYIGRQNCFVEFCELLWKQPEYLNQERFSLAVEVVVEVLGLDKKTADKYINFYKQCFPPKQNLK